MIKKQTTVVIILVVLIFLTRFIGLDYAPPNLSNDEISIAYEAYSIAKTGRDTYNNFLPTSFRSHNTYKAPVSIYLTIPTVILFGNNEYGARLPSAILGFLTILTLGLLIYELTTNKLLSLLISFVLAISPWHIFTSRMILESNIALFFLISGIYLFFYGLHHDHKLSTILSTVPFALSMYSYHTEWGFTPFILLALLFFNRKIVLKRQVYFFVVLLFLVLISPIILDYFHNLGTNARANTELIFKDPYLAHQLERIDLNLFQKAQYTLSAIFINYSAYLNPKLLFFEGMDLLPAGDPFQVGLFLAPFLPLFIIGLFKIKDVFKNNSKFIYTWIITAPLIPAITSGGPSIVRNLVSVAPYSIAIGVGGLIAWDYLKNKTKLRVLVLATFIISFFYFAVIYFYHFPYEGGEGYQYGYKQIAQYINLHYSEYQTIIIDPRFGDHNIYSGVPSSYIPYYTNLDPNKLLTAKTSAGGFSFDKYIIRNIDWEKESPVKGDLYVVSHANLPTSPSMRKILEINLPNAKPAFDLYELPN